MFISNKSKFREAVVQVTQTAAATTDGLKARRFKAIQLAAQEIRENETVQFDAVTKSVSFISRRSGKPRRATAFGCSRECDCLNSISYHRFAFEILNSYVRLLNAAPIESLAKTNVVNFPKSEMKNSTLVSYVENGIETFLCKSCGDCATISENAARADYRKFIENVNYHHAECAERTPHPAIAKHLARRVAKIEAYNDEQGRKEFTIELDDFYQNDNYEPEFARIAA